MMRRICNKNLFRLVAGLAIVALCSPSEAQTVGSSGNCNLIINGASTGNVVVSDGLCLSSTDTARLNHLMNMVSAVVKENAFSIADTRSLVAGLRVLISKAFQQEKVDEGKSSSSFAHIEAMLGDLETSVPFTMVNSGAVTSVGQTNSITAGNYIENGARHSKFFPQLSDCVTEGYSIQTSVLGRDQNSIKDNEIADALVRLNTWYGKVTKWLEETMVSSAVPAFANAPQGFPMSWSLGPDHSEEARRTYHFFQYAMPALLERLNGIASTDLYDPQSTNSALPGPCAHFVMRPDRKANQ